jgi:GDPmannose 4,6-dehydratase
MRALITGISGQDGAYLAQHLLAHHYQVVGTSRDAAVASFSALAQVGVESKVQIVSMAPTDFRSVLAALESIRPDEIYHLAGQTSVGLSFEQPVESFDSIARGTLNLLEAIRTLRLQCRFYNACSSECFGETLESGADEESLFRPRSPYGIAKAAAYWTVANYRDAYGLWACSGILFNHESPLRPSRFVTAKVAAAARNISLGSKQRLKLGNLEIERDWGWAPEYVEAMAAMLKLDTPVDLVIGTGRSASLKDLVAAMFAECGLNWEDHVDIDSSLARPSEIRRSRANPQKAYATIGWLPKSYWRDVARFLVSPALRG